MPTITPGAGWSGETATPSAQGVSTDPGYTGPPALCRWYNPNMQTWAGVKAIGVMAAHVSGTSNGITKVSFSVNNGTWVDVTTVTKDPISGRVGYWVDIDAADFSDGDVAEVRCIAYPVAGPCRVLQGEFVYTDNEFTTPNASSWWGHHSLFLTANDGLSLSQTVATLDSGGGAPAISPPSDVLDPYVLVLEAGTYDLSDVITAFAGVSADPTKRFNCITAKAGLDRDDVIILCESQGTENRNMRFKNLTFQYDAVSNTVNVFGTTTENASRAYEWWFEDCDILGKDGSPTFGWNFASWQGRKDAGCSFTGCHFTGQDGPLRGNHLAINCTFDECADTFTNCHALVSGATITNNGALGGAHPDVWQLFWGNDPSDPSPGPRRHGFGNLIFMDVNASVACGGQCFQVSSGHALAGISNGFACVGVAVINFIYMADGRVWPGEFSGNIWFSQKGSTSGHIQGMLVLNSIFASEDAYSTVALGAGASSLSNPSQSLANSIQRNYRIEGCVFNNLTLHESFPLAYDNTPLGDLIVGDQGIIRNCHTNAILSVSGDPGPGSWTTTGSGSTNGVYDTAWLPASLGVTGSNITGDIADGTGGHAAWLVYAEANLYRGYTDTPLADYRPPADSILNDAQRPVGMPDTFPFDIEGNARTGADIGAYSTQGATPPEPEPDPVEIRSRYRGRGRSR